MAATLGQPADSLARQMTEREFDEWHRYAERKMLPQRRLEMYLAQIALFIARTMGGAKDARLADFMFDPDEETDDDEEAAIEAEARAFGIKPLRKAKD